MVALPERAAISGSPMISIPKASGYVTDPAWPPHRQVVFPPVFGARLGSSGSYDLSSERLRSLASQGFVPRE